VHASNEPEAMRENCMPSGPVNEIVPRMAQSSVIVPAFPASAVEQTCKVLADAVTGSQIPNLIAPLTINAIAARQNQQKDGQPLLRLVSEVMAPVRFRSQAGFDATRALINERLLLSGFRVREDSKVARVRAAVTLDEARQRADDLRAELSRRDVHSDVLRLCGSGGLPQAAEETR
jgi:hypothetical protein